MNKQYWGQGYAPEAAGAVVQYLFEQMCVEHITATCNAANRASIRVIEKLHMYPEMLSEERMLELQAYYGVPDELAHYNLNAQTWWNYHAHTKDHSNIDTA